jgi:hypothetical protein
MHCQFNILPTLFCIYLRTNSDLCHLQHKLVGFYNRDEKRLQRGTDWVFKIKLSLLRLLKFELDTHTVSVQFYFCIRHCMSLLPVYL